MKRSMWIWGAVLLVGLAIVGFYDPIEVEPENVDAGVFGGFGPVVIVPLGYFLAFAGAAGLFISWVRRRMK